MHVDFTFHFWTAIGYIGGLIPVCKFLHAVYKQIKKGVDSMITRVHEHDEVYDWFSTRVKPKQKANGLGVH